MAKFEIQEHWSVRLRRACLGCALLFNIYCNIKQENIGRRRSILGDLGAVCRVERKGAKSTSERAPGYRISPNHFKKLKRMFTPGWAHIKMIFTIVPNR